MSRATQDTAGLLISYVYRTITFYGLTFQKYSTSKLIFVSQSYNPDIAETISVWAGPFSIATTKGITIVFFSSGY